MWLAKRQSARLSVSGGCFGCEDIFLEKALTDELFQISSKAPTMDGHVSLNVVVEQYSSAKGCVGWY